jgi:hypothetical protein
MNILATISMIERFLEQENFFWGEAVKEIEKTAQFLSAEESRDFLQSLNLS